VAVVGNLVENSPPLITAKRFDNGTVVKADKWSQVQFFSAGKNLDTKGSRALLKASQEEIAEHPFVLAPVVVLRLLKSPRFVATQESC
jgi:hypothetical protein